MGQFYSASPLRFSLAETASEAPASARMAATDVTPSPFAAHLLAFLSAVENSSTLPDFPSFSEHNAETDAIEKAVAQLAKRMYAAEDPSKGGHAWAESNGDLFLKAPTPITPESTPPVNGRALNGMSISLDGLGGSGSNKTGAFFCPTCGRPPMATSYLSRSAPSYHGSPMVLPPGPLVTAAFESGMSAVEELQLLKAQVQDVARVCKVSHTHVIHLRS